MRLTLLTCLVGLATFFVFTRPAPDIGDVDQPRYATLGLNLADHAVFSSEAYAPNANPTSSLAFAGPAIAAELALAARLDQGTKEALICIASASPHCDTRLPLLRLLHLIEILVFLASLWWIGLSILGEEWQAWLVTFIGLGFRELFEFSNVAASEPLYLMTYGLFAGAMVAGYVEHRGGAWWVLVGTLLGLTVLTKTALVILLPLVPFYLVLAGMLHKRPTYPALRTSVYLLVPAVALVGLWMLRSKSLFHTLTLTDPYYLEACLSHRLGYERMSWLEWLGGWVYYLPDFGDDLAKTLFGKETLEGLGWGPQSYYEYGAHVLHAEAHARTAPDVATGYLIKTYVLGDPLKFSAVTALLIWRGIFVGRYLGLLGLVATVIALCQMPPRQRDAFALLAFLGFAIAVMHGPLSVSIPRYNLALIPVYASQPRLANGFSLGPSAPKIRTVASTHR